MTKRELIKIAREINRFTVRTLHQDGIGTGEYEVLHVIRKNPGITQSGVCKITGLDKGAVARQTTNLEFKGYLTRKENPADGRSRLLFSAPKAESLKNSKAMIESVFLEWLTDPLSEKDRQEFCRILDILYRRCKEESKAGFPNVQDAVGRGNHDGQK